jgi:hypothetical protein
MLLGEMCTQEISLRILVNLDLVFLTVHADIDTYTVFSFSFCVIFLFGGLLFFYL